MAFLSMEDFVGNGALKEVLPKLLQEGWDDVPTLKLMKTEDMEAINMTQQQKDALEIRSYLHDHTLLQYGDKLEFFGKCLPELLGLSTDDLSAQFGMKRGHIARFMDRKTNVAACAADPLLQAPHTLTSGSKTTTPSRYNNNSINKVTMDPGLYEAAMEGKVDVLMQYIDQLNFQVTFNDNTVLHVAAQFDRLQCVEKILQECPELLRQVNIKSETPLHIAAREGHYEIVKALIERAKKLHLELESGGGAAKDMLRATNEDKDTALHMAVRSEHLDMVKLLTQEDGEFQHPVNNAEETPLYLAAERGKKGLVFEILKNCKSPGYGGPGGRTALHAAVINPQFQEKKSKERNFGSAPADDESKLKQIIRKLLGGKLELIKEADEHGWTPVHYAARFGNVQAIEQLLEMDKSVAYITTPNKNDHQTAFHIAAANGHINVMREILSKCPDCWEMVNGKGQNVLHIALDMVAIEVIKFIQEKSWSSHLKKQKDIDGNTPIHLYFAALEETNISRLQKRELTEKVSILQRHTREYDWAFNNKNMTPEDIRWSIYWNYPGWGWSWSSGWGPPNCSLRNIIGQDQEYITKMRARREECKKEKAQIEKRIKEKREENRKMGETHLIVATLIATITFAAGFTMPGGYDNNEGPKQGMPILLREAAFKAFVITNTIAVICSTSSIFLYVSASLYDAEGDDTSKRKRNKRYRRALNLILIAVAAMVVAFITGSYAVLAHFQGLAISVCVICCISFLIYFIELKYLVSGYFILFGPIRLYLSFRRMLVGALRSLRRVRD